MTDTIEELAPQVDRLVWSVNDLAAFSPRPEVAEAIERAGDETMRTVSHFARFWLDGPLSIELAEQRFPYDPPERIRSQFRSLARSGLLDETADGWVSTDRFRPSLEAVRAGRREASSQLWNTDVEEATDLIELVTSSIGPEHPVAHRHASLPRAAEPALHLFDRMTTLRYLRQHDHVAAWSAQGLAAHEVVALNRSIADGAAEVPPTLVDRGLVTAGGEVTNAGAEMRASIEEETNRRNAESWSGLDERGRRRLLELLSALPGEGR